MIKLVQSNQSNNGPSAVARTVAFSSNITAGNLIALAVIMYNSSAITVTVTDTLGHTYQQAGSYATMSGAYVSAVFYVQNTSSGANTVTVTPSASAYMSLIAAEYSGAATSSALGASGSGSGSSSSPSSGTLTVANSDSLLFGSLNTDVGVGQGVASPNGTRIVGSTTGGNQPGIGIDRYASVDSSLGLTLGSGNWVLAGAVFIPAAGGGGGTTLIVLDE